MTLNITNILYTLVINESVSRTVLCGAVELLFYLNSFLFVFFFFCFSIRSEPEHGLEHRLHCRLPPGMRRGDLPLEEVQR